jgi:hypothetical protein
MSSKNRENRALGYRGAEYGKDTRDTEDNKRT